MEKLKDVALKAVLDCVFQWRVEQIHDEEQLLLTTLVLISYLEKLPHNVRDEILARSNLMRFWRHNGHRVPPEARFIALFLHEELKQLVMEFICENFDFGFLLHVCGHKLRNVTDLKLPETNLLTVSVCAEMCQLMPNVQRLDLSECVYAEDSMMFIANLPLVTLDPGLSITDVGVKYLCGEDSIAKHTLKVLKLGNSHVSLDSYCLVLKTMKLIEDMNCFDSTWFNALSPSELRQQYNIRKIGFVFYADAPEDEMEIGVALCPKVTEVKIISNIFTPKMLHTLAKFKELNTLTVSVYSNSDVNTDEENQLADQLSLDNLRFPNLVDFTLYDRHDGWISSDYFFDILEMCPNLEKLRLSWCDGFSNKIATELAKKTVNKKLNLLIIDACELLGPYGIADLLKIKSLVKLEVNMYITEEKRQHFDLHPVEQMAEIYGVDLQLNIPVY